MATILKMYDLLKSEYDKTHTELRKVDGNLKRLNGRDNKFDFKRDMGEKVKGLDERKGFGKHEVNRKRKFSYNGKIREEESDDEMKGKKLSSMIGNMGSVKNQKVRRSEPEPAKEVCIQKEAPITDRKSLSRNRRMFGFMLGTLQKFQSEESQRKDVTTKRAEIEKKVEKAAEEEKIMIKKEKQELQKFMRQKQSELRKIELKIERVKIHQEWEKSNQGIGDFIQTKTKPCIFYAPAKHTTETEKRLKDTKDKYKLIFAERRAKVQKELSDIDESYRKLLDEEQPEIVVKDCKMETEDIKKGVENPISFLNLEDGDLINSQEQANKEILLDETNSSFEKEDLNSLPISPKNAKSLKDEGEEKEFEPIYDE